MIRCRCTGAHRWERELEGHAQHNMERDNLGTNRKHKGWERQSRYPNNNMLFTDNSVALIAVISPRQIKITLKKPS